MAGGGDKQSTRDSPDSTTTVLGLAKTLHSTRQNLGCGLRKAQRHETTRRRMRNGSSRLSTVETAPETVVESNSKVDII